MDSEGKDLLANDPLLVKLRVCEAILVNNLPMKIKIMGYLKLFKPKTTTRVFKKEENLIAWLDENGCKTDSINELTSFLDKKASNSS
jgi:hypothetical protein